MKNLLKKVKNLVKKCWNKFVKACKWIVKQVKEVAKWCVDNPEVITVGSTIIGGANWAITKFRKSKIEREQQYQRTHIYDHSIGHHWTLKRELTSYEMWELDRRKADGERLGDILKSMRVLAA